MKAEFQPLRSILARVKKPAILDVLQPPTSTAKKLLSRMLETNQQVFAGGICSAPNFSFKESLNHYVFADQKIHDPVRTELDESELEMVRQVAEEFFSPFSMNINVTERSWRLIYYGYISEDFSPMLRLELKRPSERADFNLRARLYDHGEFEWQVSFGEILGAGSWRNGRMIQQVCEWLDRSPFALFVGFIHKDHKTDLTLIWSNKPSWEFKRRMMDSTFPPISEQRSAFRSIRLDGHVETSTHATHKPQQGLIDINLLNETAKKCLREIISYRNAETGAGRFCIGPFPYKLRSGYRFGFYDNLDNLETIEGISKEARNKISERIRKIVRFGDTVNKACGEVEDIVEELKSSQEIINPLYPIYQDVIACAIEGPERIALANLLEMDREIDILLDLFGLTRNSEI